MNKPQNKGISGRQREKNISSSNPSLDDLNFPSFIHNFDAPTPVNCTIGPSLARLMLPHSTGKFQKESGRVVHTS